MALKDLLNGDPEKLAAAAQKRLDDARERLTKFDARSVKLTEEIAIATGKRRAAADDAEATGNEANYKAAVAVVKDLEEKLQRVNEARLSAREDAANAELALRTAKKGDHMHVVNRHGNRRVKEAQRMMDAIATMAEAWKNLHGINDTLLNWAPELAMNASGLALSRPEVGALVADELCRVSAPAPLSTEPDALPGSNIGLSLLGDHTKHPNIVDQITQANEEMVRRIEFADTVAPEPKAKVERLKAVASEPASQPAAPTVDAKTIQRPTQHLKV